MHGDIRLLLGINDIETKLIFKIHGPCRKNINWVLLINAVQESDASKMMSSTALSPGLVANLCELTYQGKCD